MGEALASVASVTLALVAATALAALLLALGMGDAPWFLFVFMVALFVTIPVGLLLFSTARKAGCTGWTTSGLGGMLTGVLIWLPGLFGRPNYDERWADGVATVTASRYTVQGWLEQLVPVAGFAAAGLISGLFFWFMLTRRTASLKAHLLVYAMVGMSIAGAALYPWATQDRSCHAISGETVAQLELALPSDRWPALAEELDHFAGAGGWSARKSLLNGPDFPWLDFSICREQGPRIYVLGSSGFDADEPVRISISPSRPGDGWQPAFRALHDRLKARWPSAIRYRDAHGVAISGVPDWATASPAAR